MIFHLYQQFFAGPVAPGPAQPRKLAQALAERGHEVHVVGCDFNVQSEQTEPEESHETGRGGRWTVHRVPARRGMRANLAARFAAYIGFAIGAYRRSRRLPQPDLVIGSIQPLFTGYVAYRVARRRRVPFLLEVRDLWPDALEVRRAIAGWQAAPLHRLARTLYFGADRVVSLTPGIKTELIRKGVPAERIDVFPNGFDPEMEKIGHGARDVVRKERGWEDKFVAVFTGTHTEVTSIDTIVRAAEKLRDDRRIAIELFGAGQAKPRVMRLAGSLGLQNIRFNDPVPKKEIPRLLAGADVALMTLFKSPLIHIYFENKLSDYLGAGKPILAAMDGVQADLIRKFRVGQAVPSLDHAGLAELIRQAAADPASLEMMGTNGRRLVREHLWQPAILERYAETIEAMASGQNRELTPWEPFR